MISFETVRNMKDVGIPPLQGCHKKGDKWRAKWGDLSERKLTQGGHGSGEGIEKTRKPSSQSSHKKESKIHSAVMRQTNGETQFPFLGPV